MTTGPTILYCNCSHKKLVPEKKMAAIRELLALVDAKITAVPDLCELAAKRDKRLKTLAATPGLTVIACYPRTIRWLFDWAGTPLRDDARIINIRTQSIEGIRKQLAGGKANKAITKKSITPTGEWVPWFPIIDYDRCTDCKQCQSFCPFGVYTQSDDGKVLVTNPENCKNNCPACARVCPTLAIIFPKLKDSPVNGAEVKPEDLKKAKPPADEDA